MAHAKQAKERRFLPIMRVYLHASKWDMALNPYSSFVFIHAQLWVEIDWYDASIDHAFRLSSVERRFPDLAQTEQGHKTHRDIQIEDEEAV